MYRSNQSAAAAESCASSALVVAMTGDNVAMATMMRQTISTEYGLQDAITSVLNNFRTSLIAYLQTQTR